MQDLVVQGTMLQPTSEAEFLQIQKVLDFCNENSEQTPDFKTEQFIHAGCYVRTVFLPKHSVIVGAKIKVDSVLISYGDIVLNMNGNGKRFKGYNIIKALSPRQQFIFANEDSHLTMIYATKAKTVVEAEQELTDDYNNLITRRHK